MFLGNHPLFGRQWFVATKPFQIASKAVQDWIYMDLTGAVLWAWPRTGKTYILSEIRAGLKTRANEPIGVFVVRGKTASSTTDRRFFKALLWNMGLDFKRSDEAVDLYAMLVGHLATEASRNSEKRVVFVIDEAQKLERFHYELLLDLMNDLAEVKVSLFVLSTGTSELPSKIEKFNKASDDSLRNRFFSEVHFISGLASEADVKDALKAFDDVLKVQGYVTTYTQDFLPLAYSAGFRIASVAPQMWTEFQRQWPDHKRTGWPAGYFFRSVRLLITDLISDREELAKDNVDIQTVEQAIRLCGTNQNVIADRD